MAEILELQRAINIRRERKRRESLKIDREKIADRILRFYQDDMESMSDDIDMRLQRYAKFRMWVEGKDWPWENCSDAKIPDVMTTSLAMQDTLHNAVMSTRPPISSEAFHSVDKDKQTTIDNLIDYQVFVEQGPSNEGEKIIGELIECFVNDGVMTAFIPWVTEDKVVSDIRIHPKIPDEMLPAQYFREILLSEFPHGQFRQKEDGWDWEVFDKETIDVSFYTRDDFRIEMVMEREVRVFDGPKILVKSIEDVLHPARASNLQSPGPSNPGGAAHVILIDYPNRDEIKRLAKSKFYDLITEEEIEGLDPVTKDESAENEAVKKQKEDFQGRYEQKKEETPSHGTLTRLTCFDRYDVDGDGLDEDVIFWMIKETKTVLKAKHLTEMYPSNPPRRPFAEAQFLPIKDSRLGISLLEMVEGIHDLVKQLFDQGIDNGTIKNAPFWFYRPTGTIKPEVIRLWPGEGYPLGDPKSDVNFPSFGNQDQAWTLNMLSLLGQWNEKLTVIGDLQLGRVPHGKASALRTVSGMQTVLSQGEARPERVLRRLFMGLAEIWQQIHELNQTFLPEKKKFKIAGFVKPNQDPYQEITDKKQIEGRYQFTFKANAFNTSKMAMQQALNEMIATLINPLMIQLGLVTPDNVYNMLRDKAKSQGQDPDKYITAPSVQPKILAEEAIDLLLAGQAPHGEPMEGAQVHLQKLMEFQESDNFGMLDPSTVPTFAGYVKLVKQKVAMEMHQQMMMQNAQAFTQGTGQRQAAQPQTAPLDVGTRVENNELLDETLPGNGRPQ